ncbi:unnamed protein product, partial [Symbiodinium microadriaticum]
MRVTGSTLIDASQSFDSDNNVDKGLAAGLNFVFLCHQTYPSYLDDCGLSTSASGGMLTLSVPNQNASFLDTEHEIIVSVIHSTDLRSDKVSVKLKVIPSLGALVAVRSKDGTRVNSEKKLTIIGTIEYQSAGTALWTVSDSSVGLSVASPLSSTLVPVGGNVLKTVSMVIPANTLAHAASYTFSLAASISGGNTFTASVTVSTNSPPTPGYFTVDPTSGEEFNTPFEAKAPKWEDDDIPITYEFAHGASGDGTFIVYRSRMQLSHSTAKLPTGASADNSYDLQLQVYDVLDGRSSATVQVVVSATDVSNDDMAYNLNSSLSGDTAAVKQSTALVNEKINSVKCDGVSQATCDAYNRKACSRVKDTGGKCKSGYSGVHGHDNSYCASTSSSSSVRYLSSVAATCTSDSDCS